MNQRKRKHTITLNSIILFFLGELNIAGVMINVQFEYFHSAFMNVSLGLIIDKKKREFV